MSCYHIPRLEKPDAINWQCIPPAPISHYLWQENGFCPLAAGRLAWLPQGLAVYLCSDEKEPRCTFQNWQDPVYQDSCLEFFINFTPLKTACYFNFEINAAGTMLAQYGEAGTQRPALKLESWADKLSIRAGISADGWHVCFMLPWELVRHYQEDFQPEPGRVAVGNFYKCGDHTPLPHYGCWNRIELQRPNFHRPEFFAPLVFES